MFERTVEQILQGIKWHYVRMFSMLITLAVLGMIAWIVQTYLPVPGPFKIVIQGIIALCAIYVLLGFVGVVPMERVRLFR